MSISIAKMKTTSFIPAWRFMEILIQNYTYTSDTHTHIHYRTFSHDSFALKPIEYNHMSKNSKHLLLARIPFHEYKMVVGEH